MRLTKDDKIEFFTRDIGLLPKQVKNDRMTEEDLKPLFEQKIGLPFDEIKKRLRELQGSES